MTPEVIDRLEKSFQLIAPRAQQFVDLFYHRLFTNAPQVKPMFPEDMSSQKKKLLASLVLVVNNLRSPEKLRQPLLDMGARHAEYGTQPEHYPVVRDTLLETMAELAGDAWSDQLTADWSGAIDFVAGVMIEGQQNAGVAASH